MNIRFVPTLERNSPVTARKRQRGRWSNKDGSTHTAYNFDTIIHPRTRRLGFW